MILSMQKRNEVGDESCTKSNGSQLGRVYQSMVHWNDCEKAMWWVGAIPAHLSEIDFGCAD